jgi:hypothetical protein
MYSTAAWDGRFLARYPYGPQVSIARLAPAMATGNAH